MKQFSVTWWAQGLEMLSTYPSPFHKQFFHHHSNSLETSLSSHPSCTEVIAMKFCTLHDICAVVARAKFCINIIIYIRVTLKPIFHQLNYDGKIFFFLKWAPWAFCEGTPHYWPLWRESLHRGEGIPFTRVSSVEWMSEWLSLTAFLEQRTARSI